jgi:SAM-dependent methyltransferase
MDAFTRKQLLALSEAFYRAHANAFDASRGHHAWPGWTQLLPWLPAGADASDRVQLEVLDIGCGNARFARFLDDAGFELEYTGVDANAALLAAARERLPAALAARCRLFELDFLASQSPGSELPSGPFDCIALMGVLHHVPGRDWRLALLRAARDRLRKGGMLALAAWQFVDRPRFAAREVEWGELGAVLERPVDRAALEDGDRLLRFGNDPSAPPRYCHQVADREFEGWPVALGLEALAEYRADGAEGDLNRYWILRRGD